MRVAMRWKAALPVAALRHAHVANKAVAVGAGSLVALNWRRVMTRGGLEGVERAERPLMRQLLGQQACVQSKGSERVSSHGGHRQMTEAHRMR